MGRYFNTFTGLVLLIVISSQLWADHHVRPRPEDYILKQDLTLSTGRVIPAGTVWYKKPDYRRLKHELETGKFKGDIRWAQSVLFGREIIYDTYYTIGEGRRDRLPAFPPTKPLLKVDFDIRSPLH